MWNPKPCSGHKKTKLQLSSVRLNSVYNTLLTYSSCCCHTWALPCLHSRWCSRTGSRHRHTGRHTPGMSSAQRRIRRRVWESVYMSTVRKSYVSTFSIFIFNYILITLVNYYSWSKKEREDLSQWGNATSTKNTKVLAGVIHCLNDLTSKNAKSFPVSPFKMLEYNDFIPFISLESQFI